MLSVNILLEGDIINTLNINLGARSYPIHLVQDGWTYLPCILDQKLKGNSILVVSDSNVYPLYFEAFQSAFAHSRFHLYSAVVEAGEGSKSIDSACSLYSRALEEMLDRSSAVISLGGGVVGDLAGFVAATYMRGIDFVQIPTSLLAQVDSSIGGKVAVNLPEAKNIIGAFYQPKVVYMNIQTLQTLPCREFSTGMAELIKHGFIWNSDFLVWLENHMDRIMARDSDILSQAVYRSCCIKAKIVEEDEREKGLRAILNFGHTVGHAIEAITGYSHYTHGEAVALGMICEAKLAKKMGLVDICYIECLSELLQKAGLPVRLEGLDWERLIELMTHDKKNEDGKIVFVLPVGQGRMEIHRNVPKGLILQVLNE